MPNKGFISITHVLDAIDRKRGVSRHKSVPNRPAQISDLCDVGPGLPAMATTIKAALQHWRSHWPLIYYFATIQIETGARVSEILRITSHDISADSRIRIHALKNGIDRIVRVPQISDWLQRERSMKRRLFADLNRFQIHRAYVKQGIAAYFGSNTKRSTTHLFRHLVGLDLNSLKEPQHAIRSGLGQKTDKAADHYRTDLAKQSNT